MKLTEVVKQFVEQENTDFAILINGSWGSGKTYFIKGELKSEINKIQYQLVKKESIRYELVYVSLFGLANAEEIQKRLFLEMNPVLKTKMAGLAYTLLMRGYEKVLGKEKDEKELLNIFGGIPKNRVLVFDDLERLSAQTTNEVFGFINTYTEHQNLKVIIVADEEKLKAKLEDYDTIKEKLIRFTFHFNPDLAEVFPGFISRYKNDEIKKYLKTNASFICDLFTKGNHNNLRTLRFVLDLFDPLYHHVVAKKNIDDEFRKYILKSYLFFLTTYSIEYKKSVNLGLISALKKISCEMGTASFDRELFKVMKQNMMDEGTWKDEKLTPGEEFAETFEKTYLDGTELHYDYYQFLVDYIYSGDLDLKQLEETTRKYNAVLNSRKTVPELIALEKLENCLELDDTAFRPIIDEVLDYVKQGKYILEKYPAIFENLLNCSGIDDLVIDQPIIDLFKSGMKKSLGISVYRPVFRPPGFSLYSGDPSLIDIRNFALELNNSIKVSTEKEFANRITAALTAHNVDDFQGLMSSDLVKDYPVFQEANIQPAVFLDLFILLSNKEKLLVCDILENSFGRFMHYRRNLVVELSFYVTLGQLLQSNIDKSAPKKISTVIYSRLNGVVNRIIEMLNALR